MTGGEYTIRVEVYFCTTITVIAVTLFVQNLQSNKITSFSVSLIIPGLRFLEVSLYINDVATCLHLRGHIVNWRSNQSFKLLC